MSSEEEEVVEVPGRRGNKNQKSIKRKTKLLPLKSSELTVLKEMLDKLCFEKLATEQKLNPMVAITKSLTGAFFSAVDE